MWCKQLLIGSLALAAAAPLAAEDAVVTVFGTPVAARAGDTPQESYGGNLNRSVIQVTEWQEVDSTSTWAHPLPGYLNATSASMFVYAPIELDTGVEVTQVCLETQDTSTTAGVTLLVAGFESAGPGSAPVFVPLEAVGTGTTPAPGFSQLCATVNPVLIIRTSADLDGAGGAHTVQYWVGAISPLGTTTGVGPAVITSRRTVSPAPPAASFTDVPTGHPFFRFVEALAASGITGGCGAGVYCPDSAITRGEMAVFLSVALGLYWPN